MQTKVISMDGRPAGDQYLPSYLSISSWYSPSKCHLQIQNPSAPLQVNTAPLPGVNSTAGVSPGLTWNHLQTCSHLGEVLRFLSLRAGAVETLSSSVLVSEDEAQCLLFHILSGFKYRPCITPVSFGYTPDTFKSELYK